MTGEFELIRRLAASCLGSGEQGFVGPSDDAAVLPASIAGISGSDVRLLYALDVLVEDVHFRTAYSTFADIGWKALACNISDIAAMGGRCSGAVVGLQLRPGLLPTQLTELYRGMAEIGARFNAPVVGGDIVNAETFAVSVAILGWCAHPPLLRSGARPGDEIWVSGALGGAGCGLRVLASEGASDRDAPEIAEAVTRHRRPVPRVSLGAMLAERALAHAAIDLSDGLMQDAGHVARQSEVALVIRVDDLPITPAARILGIDPLEAVCAGDDYELLCTAAADDAEALRTLHLGCNAEDAAPLTRIGRVLAASEALPAGVYLEEDEAVIPAEEVLRARGLRPGYQHGGA